MSFVDRLFPRTRESKASASPAVPPSQLGTAQPSAVYPVAPTGSPPAGAPADWQPAPYAAGGEPPPSPPTPVVPGAAAPAPEPRPAPARQDVEARRQALSRQLAELQWDLGGLAYEMAIRDHFRLDVLAKRAARLQEVDAELAEVERQLRLEDAGASGECPSCGSLHSRGAVFCWACGNQLLPTQAAGGAPPSPPPAG